MNKRDAMEIARLAGAYEAAYEKYNKLLDNHRWFAKLTNDDIAEIKKLNPQAAAALDIDKYRRDDKAITRLERASKKMMSSFDALQLARWKTISKRKPKSTKGKSHGR